MVKSFEKFTEFDNHKLLIPLYDSGKLFGFIAIHRGSFSHPAFGATRVLSYSHPDEALKDVLRLSRLMSYKSAISGLPYGGAKAVLFGCKASDRRGFLKQYMDTVNFLRGAFITGSDVGLSSGDVRFMRQQSKYTVGVSTDPVKYTVLGIMAGIQVCLSETFGSGSIQGRSFALQGLGKIGSELLRSLNKDAQEIFVCDTDNDKVNTIKKQFPRVKVVSPSEIFLQKADVYCPSALGNVFTEKNISTLSCKIVAGGANNQLENNEIGDLLYQRGILYAPDYVINAGGLISVVEEYENPTLNEEKLFERVCDIKKTLQKIIAISKKLNKPTNRVADEMAEKVFATFQ